MRHVLSTVALAPILVVQGRRVRREVERLPEAAGPREGVAGSGLALRLLVLGDSAGAGVGAPDQERALAGRLVARLARQRRVEWCVVARSGATTRWATAAARSRSPDVVDVAVTSLGVNDVTRGLSRGRWRREQRELRDVLRRHLGARRLVISGLPPMRRFPALPQPLRWYLGARADEFTRDLARDVAREPDCTFLDLRFSRDAGTMARDGFHPGPDIYDEWGRRAAEAILAAEPGP